MAFTGHGWRSGRATDITGSAATTTVGSLAPNTAAKSSTPVAPYLQVNGTGFTASSVIYAQYAPLPTTYVSATIIRTTAFRPRPDSGTTIPVGVRNPGQQLSNTLPFTAT